MGLLVLMQLTSQSATSIPTKPEVVFVEGGTFSMGSNRGEKDESPVHSVTIDSFSIGKYEVTVGQYRAFCIETNRSMPEVPIWGWQDHHPMGNVSYDDAVAYCNWLVRKFGGNWRLPTEAEWEYAARGGNKSKGYIYSGSNDFETVAWFDENAGEETNSVGRKKPNELGIYDMSGNLWEWCSDWYDENYYSNSPGSNPQGPSSGYNRVMRGGSWTLFATNCPVSVRAYDSPEFKIYDYGFRVVLSR